MKIMGNPWLSVCVPTFNRVDLLNYLYQSLVSQNSSDIELVIVNDGSRDGTETLVQDWIAESRVRIQYYYQNNAGRGSALRKVLLNAEGEYTIIMDDDDYFVEGAFKRIKESLLSIDKKNGLKRKLAGICCLCLSEDGDVLGDEFPDQNYISDFFTMRLLKQLSGDKKEIVRTSILKEHIFPNFENESRVVTSTLWNRIAYNYNCLCLNYPVAIKRYIKGGMSHSLLRLKAESPNYQIEDCIITINYPNRFSFRVILLYSTILWKYWFFGGKLNLSRIMLIRLPFVLLGFPLGVILFIKDWWKLKFRGEDD
jgi:glycosyltransferase involved in cell wall biosynthesis|tara:strand:- start:1324 stop:2256 length:933 start_codon:yes stop_codon:yes gene_type:complete